MTTRPSEPLLKILRDVARNKGMNTAALARAADLDRAHLKHVLAGSEPLTVDELMVLSSVLEIEGTDLASLPDASEAPTVAPEPLKATDDDIRVSPYGNHAEQALRLGFAMGCDLFISLTVAELEDSGIPRHVLAAADGHLPLRLDAAWHHAQNPRFHPTHLEISLSFDSLYTVSLPWEAFAQVTFIPLPPEPIEEPPPQPPSGGGHLRLVQ